MLDQDIYEALEMELERNHIREDVDEVLLDLAEALADRGIMDKELVLTESYGKKWRQHTHDDNQTGIFAKGAGDRSSV